MRALYFTKSAGYEHSVVSHAGGEPSHSEAVLAAIGASHDVDVTFSKDGSLFTPDTLAGFDVIVFYTSGDLLSRGADGQPPLTPEGKRALIDAVAAGKGFVGIHSAAATFHKREPADGPDPYVRMLGGAFIHHGAPQTATVSVPDAAFPGCGALGREWTCHEEWYSTKEFAADLHAILVMQTAGMEGIDYQRPPYPLAWARPHGRGRVWYTAMGHGEDMWDTPRFRTMLAGGIEWAGGRIDADVTPNLATVAPDAGVLPPGHGVG
jgi:hypothetical protein